MLLAQGSEPRDEHWRETGSERASAAGLLEAEPPNRCDRSLPRLLFPVLRDAATADDGRSRSRSPVSSPTDETRICRVWVSIVAPHPHPQGEITRRERRTAAGDRRHSRLNPVLPQTSYIPFPRCPGVLPFPGSDEKVCISASDVTRPLPPRANREDVKNIVGSSLYADWTAQRRVPANGGRRLRDTTGSGAICPATLPVSFRRR